MDMEPLILYIGCKYPASLDIYLTLFIHRLGRFYMWMKGVAAVAVLLHRGETLLMKRIERDDDPWSGDISFPGGRLVESDSDLLDTALRELREEAGIILRRGDGYPVTVGVFTPMSFPDYRVYAIAFHLDRKMDPVPGPEADTLFWIDLNNVSFRSCVKKIRATGLERHVECIETEYGDIWGLTLRIIKRLKRDFI